MLMMGVFGGNAFYTSHSRNGISYSFFAKLIRENYANPTIDEAINKWGVIPDRVMKSWLMPMDVKGLNKSWFDWYVKFSLRTSNPAADEYRIRQWKLEMNQVWKKFLIDCQGANITFANTDATKETTATKKWRQCLLELAWDSTIDPTNYIQV
jgi:hypothetical protein